MNLRIGKQIGPELEFLALRETDATGFTVTGYDLAREIFVWAFDRYTKAGSLARFKSARLVYRRKKTHR